MSLVQRRDQLDACDICSLISCYQAIDEIKRSRTKLTFREIDRGPAALDWHRQSIDLRQSKHSLELLWRMRTLETGGVKLPPTDT